MFTSNQERKEKAIKLRLQGFTYSEILSEVDIAKSTLSQWLNTVNLSKRQKQKLSEKKYQALLRGGAQRRKNRILLTNSIYNTAQKEVSELSQREIWLMGIMLYWGEGAKSKDHNISQGVIFSNSDPNMIRVFLIWLNKSIHIQDDRIIFEIYIHDSHKHSLNQVRLYWSNVTGFPISKFSRIYFKKHTTVTNRKNTNNNYYGLLRIKVTRSTNLNRKITGWVNGIFAQCGVV